MRTNRNAMTVYMTLRWLAGGRRAVQTTRARITEVCELSSKRISAAMTALNAAGWVHLNYGRTVNRSWYRVSFVEISQLPVGLKTTHRSARKRHPPVGPKTTHRDATGGAENDLQECNPCRAENDPLTLKGKGRPTAPPLTPHGAGGAAALAPPKVSTSPSLGTHLRTLPTTVLKEAMPAWRALRRAITSGNRAQAARYAERLAGLLGQEAL